MSVVFVELIKKLLLYPHATLSISQIENSHQLDLKVKAVRILEESGLLKKVDETLLLWKKCEEHELTFEALNVLRFLNITVREYLLVE